jgi:hypothetical protein
MFLEGQGFALNLNRSGSEQSVGAQLLYIERLLLQKQHNVYGIIVPLYAFWMSLKFYKIY